jgi:hypothetical protein
MIQTFGLLTPAPRDSTPHAKGAVNLRRNSVCGVTFGDGENNEANAVFHLPGLITDASGKELQSVKMCNVKHVKSAKFNLFSITKRQEDGWILHGNRDTIWLTKEDKTVVFNIKIKTSEGMVFAMNIKRKEEEQTQEELEMPPEDEEGKELYKSNEEIIESSENTCSDSMKSSGSKDSNTQESQEVHEMQAIEEEKPKKDVHEEMPKNDLNHGIKAVAKDQELAQQKYKKRIKTCKDKSKNKKDNELGNIQVEEGVGRRLPFPSGYLNDSDLEGSVEWPAMTAMTGGVTQLVTVTPN